MTKKSLIYLNEQSRCVYYRVVRATAVPEEQLGVVRVVLGVFLGFFYLPTFSWLANVPDAFFSPPPLSIAAFFNGFTGGVFLHILDIILVLSIMCLTLGIKSRWAGALYTLSFLIGSSFEFSLGAVSHVFLLPAVIFCLSFSNWGVHYALVPDKVYKNIGGLGLPLVGILVAFAFFTAGILKLFVWMDFDLGTTGFLNWFYSGYFNFGRSQLLTDWVFNFPALLLEIMDYAVIIFEISAIVFLLMGKRYWVIWLIIACFFHLGTTLLLNIHFIQHVPIYMIFLLPPVIKIVVGRPFVKTILFIPLALPFLWRMYLILSDQPRIFLFSVSALVDPGGNALHRAYLLDFIDRFRRDRTFSE